jgi:hypothetical protein
VRPLDALEVAVLENRARAVPQIRQEPGQPFAIGHPLASRERVEESLRRCSSALAQIREHRDRGHLIGRPSGDLDAGNFRPQPRRTGVPQHRLGQVAQADGAVPGGRDDRASHVDRDLDRPVISVVAPPRSGHGPQRRRAGQRRRLVAQHTGPCTLDPGRLAGVIDEHAGQHPRQLPTSQCSLDRGRRHAVLLDLPA